MPRRANAFRVRPVMTTSIRLPKIPIYYTVFEITSQSISKVKYVTIQFLRTDTKFGGQKVVDKPQIMYNNQYISEK